MINMKKLQVAAAVASLFAMGATHAATLNSSGAIVAAETVFKSVVGADTRVRAPEFTYAYEGGVSAAASSQQNFAIAITLGGIGEWAPAGAAATVGAATDILVPGTTFAPILARTIQAIATVGGATGRVAVLLPGDTLPVGQFAIVLNSVVVGNKIGNPADVSPQSYTFKFSLVNGTAQNVSLQQLRLAFNTRKPVTPAGDPLQVAAGLGGPQPALDLDTGADNASRDRFLTIWRLNGMSADTAGTNATSCLDLPTGSNSLIVNSGINEPPVPSSEETLNNNSNSRVTINNYLNIRRALNIAIGKLSDRYIQLTNSFQTNLGATPVNGTGGTGGGRYSFKPTTVTVTPNYGTGTNGLFTVGPVGDGNATLDGVGTFPVRTTSGDERGASIGTIAFGGHPSSVGINALDRQLDVDPYTFAPEVLGGAQGVGADSSINPSGPGRSGDFTISTLVGGGAPANVFGGVDIVQVGANNALSLTFTSKPGFSGFAQGALPGQISLVAPGGVCAAVFPAVAGGATALGTLTEPVANSGNYLWTFTRTELAAAAAASSTPNTLRGTWTVCYAVNGNSQIPQTSFTNVVATILKDDVTEQPNTSCPSTLANVLGGVKIDVRNFQLVGVLPGGDPTWQGILRVINNSETEPATVEAQYIHNSGAYGKWGVIVPTLAPRGAVYVTDAEVLAKLTNVPTVTGVPVNATGPVLATDTTIRLRVSADVSTLRVQNYVYNSKTGALTEVSASQGADFVNIDSSNRDHIDQDAQTDIKK